MAVWPGVPAYRVVAVVAELPGGRVQWGSGFLVSGGRVLTAWHCTIDKESKEAAISLSVIRKSDGTPASVDVVVKSPDLDVAVLQLGKTPWARESKEWRPPKFGRVDRRHGGELEKCQAIGYPLFQLDPADLQRNTAEVHGKIRRTDDDESGFLLLRDPDLSDVSVPVSVPVGQRAAGSPWGGLSGALVFYQGYALGIVVEHHPRQGRAAIRILPVDRIAAAPDPDTRAVADALGLPSVAELPWITDEPLDPWAELLAEGISSDPVEVLAGERDAPGWSSTVSLLKGTLRGPGGALPFAGRDRELAMLDHWLADPDPAAPAYHLVSGNAGTGKSTLLARWAASLVERGSRPHVVFVPVSERYWVSGALRFFPALLHRLARIHGLPYDDTYRLSDLQDKAAALLTRSAPGDSTLLVIVDGLDEASDWQPGPQYFPRQLGERVRVLISARHTGQRPTPQAWRDLLELETGQCATTELLALGPEAMVRLLEQVRGAAADGTAEMAQRLHQLTDGEPVVTALYLRELAEYPEVDATVWPDEAGSVSHGIKGYFERWRTEQNRLWKARDAKRVKRAWRVLKLLSLAEGAIERGHLRLLARRVGLNMDGERLGHALELLDRFVLPGPERTSVMLAHPLIGQALRQRLRDDDEYESYACVYVDWADEVLNSLLEGSVLPDQVPRYLIRHASAHLLPAGQDGGVEAAVEMPNAYRLVHPKWRRAATGDLLGYRRDVSRVAAYARSANAAAVAAGETPPYLPEQIGCAAALVGEQASLSTGMTPQLAGQLVRYGLWRPSRALDYVAWLPGSASPTEGVVAVAPYVSREDLPVLRQILDRLLTAYPEEIAWATTAWARRLLELLGPQAALAAAWLPADHRQRDMVAVWVLAELVPHLPTQLARRALAEALQTVQRCPDDVVYAVAHLTRQISPELADSLWTPQPQGASSEGGPAQTLIDVYGDELGAEHGVPFMSWTGTYWRLNSRSFVAAASWLDEEVCARTLATVLEDLPVTEAQRSSGLSELVDHIQQGGYRFSPDILPDLYYQGLMSAVPASLAVHVATSLTSVLSHQDLAICLLQLLPVLPDEARDGFAAEAFRQPQELDNVDLNVIEAVGPAVGRAGYADQVLTALESGAISGTASWLRVLGPYLTKDQAERALRLSRPIALARLASFGPHDAARALDLVYGNAEDRLSGTFVSFMKEHLANFTHHQHPEPDPYTNWGTTRYGTPWWERGTYLGVPWRRASGLSAYLRRPEDKGSLRALLRASQHDTNSPEVVAELTDREAVALAFEAAGGLVTEDLPTLRALAASREDHWAGLTVLGAGTHLRDPSLRAEVTAEVANWLKSLREASRTEAPAIATRQGLPERCPWLMLKAGDWTPFFVRILHKSAWPGIKPLLFDGGYLNGVKRIHSWHEENKHERLDDWAHDILAYTPILDCSELKQIASRTRKALHPKTSIDAFSGVTGRRSRGLPTDPSQLRSATTRGWFWAGLAIGYAARSEHSAAAACLSEIGGDEADDAVSAALTEMGAAAAPGALLDWLQEVHKFVRNPSERSQLWRRVLNNRWPELSKEQCWAAIDQWLATASHRTRADILAEAVAYADAVDRLAGPTEVRRILALADPDVLSIAED